MYNKEGKSQREFENDTYKRCLLIVMFCNSILGYKYMILKINFPRKFMIKYVQWQT